MSQRRSRPGTSITRWGQRLETRNRVQALPVKTHLDKAVRYLNLAASAMADAEDSHDRTCPNCGETEMPMHLVAVEIKSANTGYRATRDLLWGHRFCNVCGSQRNLDNH